MLSVIMFYSDFIQQDEFPSVCLTDTDMEKCDYHAVEACFEKYYLQGESLWDEVPSLDGNETDEKLPPQLYYSKATVKPSLETKTRLFEACTSPEIYSTGLTTSQIAPNQTLLTENAQVQCVFMPSILNTDDLCLSLLAQIDERLESSQRPTALFKMKTKEDSQNKPHACSYPGEGIDKKGIPYLFE